MRRFRFVFVLFPPSSIAINSEPEAELTASLFMAILQTMNYPGGKNGAGIAQRIINLQPPHKRFIELFLGSGAIMRAKRPAAINIGIDKLPGAIASFNDTGSDTQLINGCAIDWLDRNKMKSTDLIYADPPYVHSTRCRTDIYDHELTDAQHEKLLRLLNHGDAMVMISGYMCELYADMLTDWNMISYPARTRGSTKTEYLWYNFPDPLELHDYRYLGDDFRARERIKRKKQRWIARLETMPQLERLNMMAAIVEVFEISIDHRHKKRLRPAIIATNDDTAGSIASAGDS